MLSIFQRRRAFEDHTRHGGSNVAQQSRTCRVHKAWPICDATPKKNPSETAQPKTYHGFASVQAFSVPTTCNGSGVELRGQRSCRPLIVIATPTSLAFRVSVIVLCSDNSQPDGGNDVSIADSARLGSTTPAQLFSRPEQGPTLNSP